MSFDCDLKQKGFCLQVLGQLVSTIQTEASLKKALLLAGFAGWTTVDVVNGVGLAPGFSNATKLFDAVAVGHHILDMLSRLCTICNLCSSLLCPISASF